MDDLSTVTDVEVPGGFVLSAERMREQIRWSQKHGRANAFMQKWTHESGREVMTVVDLYDERWPTLSVTNDAERIVATIFNTHGDMPVVYRDTEGQWDELRHREGYFACFRFLGAKTPEEAIDRVLAYHELDAEQQRTDN